MPKENRYKIKLPEPRFYKGDMKLVAYRLPQTLIEALDKYAKWSGHSINDIVRDALDQAVTHGQELMRKSKT